MLRSLLATIGLLSFLLLRACSDVPAVRFRGSFDCKTGIVKFTRGNIKKRTFPSLDTAIEVLHNEQFDSEDWLADFKRSLQEACANSSSTDPKHHSAPLNKGSFLNFNSKSENLGHTALVGYEITVNAPHTPLCPALPHKLIELQREGETVEFKVYDAKAKFIPRTYLDVATQKNGCRKISDTPYCIKCPDGKIYCDIRPCY